MVNNTLIKEAESSVSMLNPIILDILLAVILFFLGFIIGKIVERLILKLFEISDIDRVIKQNIGIKIKFSFIVAKTVSYIIYLFAIVMSLNTLKIATPVITTIVIVLIIVLILFFIFGMNDMFANFSSGLFVRFKKDIKKGDYIRVKDKNVEGYIVDMNLFNIQLETRKDEIVLIPNMILFKSEIIKPKKKKH